MLIDGCGRKIDYLRLSVTDRCDLRCAYCWPPVFDGYELPDHWLTFDEIDRLAGIFIRLGITHIRLTGGEPLLRARIGDLAGRLRRHTGLHDLSLSTNGTQLKRLAPQLREAGVNRLNVSLDTLSRARFHALTHRDALQDVLDGLTEARTCGFDLIKINMVWLPNVNGDELDAMIDYCVANGFILRLIENMPMGDAARRLGSSSLQPVMDRLRKRHGLIDHILPGHGPARYLATPDKSFSVGFVTPISRHFCDTCNRIRLAVDGRMYLCLGQNDTVDLRSLLRSGCTDDDIKASLLMGLRNKPERHDFREQPQRVVRVMSSTGG